MNFAFSDEQEELRRYARSWLAERAGRRRAVIGSSAGYDLADWAQMVEMGWPAMAISEEYGGQGYGFLELAVLFEELGREVHPSPFLFTVMAADLLASADREVKARWLPRLAAGETATVAWLEGAGDWTGRTTATAARSSGSGLVVNGLKRYVSFGHSADIAVIVAATGEKELRLLVTEAGDGAVPRRLDSLDLTCPLSDLEFSEVELPAGRVVGEQGEGAALLARFLNRAAVAVALDQVGGARACLDMAVAYAKERRQFGRPIGSFQAVKHLCADMLVQVESSAAAAYYAAWAVSEDSAEVETVAPLARSYCSEAYAFCAATNIQVHGGIGFTWEHDAHLYYRRAKALELMLGTPAENRSVLAERIGLG